MATSEPICIHIFIGIYLHMCCLVHVDFYYHSFLDYIYFSFHIYTFTCICDCLGIPTDTCMSVHLYPCIYIYINVYVYMCVSMYM